MKLAYRYVSLPRTRARHIPPPAPVYPQSRPD
jgi:hypothetical protein